MAEPLTVTTPADAAAPPAGVVVRTLAAASGRPLSRRLARIALGLIVAVGIAATILARLF